MKALYFPAMAPLKLVLDTNVVLDWLVFKRASMQMLHEERITVVTSAAALDELQRVLTYPQLKLDEARRKEVLDAYQARATPGAVPDGFARDNLHVPPEFPRCKDRSDEHFLALVYHAGADALVSKDKAVLKLRKRARKLGLKILDVPQFLELAAETPISH